jgi:hypothetical protein
VPTRATTFSQANKLCFRATPAQAGWLAQHMADTGHSISRVLREAIDLYIAAETSRVAPNVVTAQDPVREHVERAPAPIS